MLKILYFAWVRERIGLDEERVEPPPSVATVAELALWLAQRSAGHAAAFSDLTKLRAAVDQRFSGLDGSIEGAEEVAYFPPVTGG